MELQGKLICFLGDSITEGTGASCPAARFVDRVAALSGADCRNYGIGGTRYARQKTASAESRWDQDFCERIDHMEPQADVVVIYGGTNDFGHGDAPMGTMADRTPDTFYGALHTVYSHALITYPQAEVVVLTPLHRSNEENAKGERGLHQNATLADYVAAIREVAAYYALPVLDLFATAGMQPAIPANCERYFQPDGLHPNDVGHDRVARRVVGFLKTL